MAYVITDRCALDCAMECVRVCPVDVIHGARSEAELAAVAPAERATRFSGLQLYIDADDCISCGACEPECPAEAIFDEDSVPAADATAPARAAAFFRARRGG